MLASPRMTFDWHSFCNRLPFPAPAGLTTKIPHDGMPEDVIVLAEQKGYEPVDVRFLEGKEQILAILRGSAIGTVQVDQTKVHGLRLAAQIYGLLDKDRGKDKEPGQVKSLDEMLQVLTTTTPRKPKAQKKSRRGGEGARQRQDRNEPLMAPPKTKYVEQAVGTVSLDNAVKHLTGES